ncbi:MAG: DUF5680 domain-containing protein [Nanoarchaeota archaeon]
MPELNLKKLAEFLVKAKKNTYASLNKMEIEPERPGFDELEFEGEGFYYRDSYVGFFQAPGMEVVRLDGKNGKSIWTMAYSGGMLKKYHGDVDFAKKVFTFLKKALEAVSVESPFRGPKNLKDNEWEYVNDIEGDIERFVGYEKIFFKKEEVFSQDYIGGIVLDK